MLRDEDDTSFMLIAVAHPNAEGASYAPGPGTPYRALPSSSYAVAAGLPEKHWGPVGNK